jgi:hypothetical protein
MCVLQICQYTLYVSAKNSKHTWKKKAFFFLEQGTIPQRPHSGVLISFDKICTHGLWKQSWGICIKATTWPLKSNTINEHTHSEGTNVPVPLSWATLKKTASYKHTVQ